MVLNEEQRKYMHLRMLLKDIQFNCYKIRLHTDTTRNLKENMSEIEALTNDIDIKIKEAIEREILFE
jgi:hypothetical protein